MKLFSATKSAKKPLEASANSSPTLNILFASTERKTTANIFPLISFYKRVKSFMKTATELTAK